MKKSLLTTLIASLLLFGIAFNISEAAVRVNGYYRKNGTYVQPYYRSNPDGNPYNNYSYPGNTNPYTGKTASGNPDTYLKNYYSSPNYTVPKIVPPITYASPPIAASLNPTIKNQDDTQRLQQQINALLAQIAVLQQKLAGL